MYISFDIDTHPFFFLAVFGEKNTGICVVAQSFCVQVVVTMFFVKVISNSCR